MPTMPFHPAGMPSAAAARLAPDAFGSTSLQLAGPSRPDTRGSRRQRLWELPHKCHCPLVGVCFGVAELRTLVARVMEFPRNTADFALHTTAVGACETRGRLSELLHKTLEKRFHLVVRRFAAAKDGTALRGLWQEALARGTEIPGALWAAWSHPACDKALEQEIYGDIHMLQHQVGSGTRAELQSLKAARDESRALRQQLEALSRETESLRSEKARETALLGERVAALRVELAAREAWGANLTSQLDTFRQALPDLKNRQSLLRRAHDADARAAALAAHAAAQESELLRLRARLQHAEEALDQACQTDAAPAGADELDPAALRGRCVLCVGGRSSAVDAYRQLVETRGGRFLHHDGGLEESLHRIDGALAAADLVICQAGCISHNAYWRVKEQCKRSGKRCLFVKNAGISSFARTVDAAAGVPLAE